MPSAQVPTGVGAPVVLQVPIVTSQAPSLPPLISPMTMPVRPVMDVDMTTVTAVTLKVTRPDGMQTTWNASVPGGGGAQPEWQPGHAYALNALITADPFNGYYYKATAVSGTGTSGGQPPSFPTVPGQTVIDNAGANQITWTCMGAATTTSTVTATYAFQGNETGVMNPPNMPSAYQIEPVLTVPGGSVPCKATTLVVTPPQAA